MRKILLIFGLGMLCFLSLGDVVHSAAVSIPGTSEIRDVSLDIGSSGNAVQDISNAGFRILTIVKRVLMGLLIIFLVYTGAMMIMSMGSDEERLSASKRQLWYALVALVFINIPGTLYEAFYNDAGTVVGDRVSTDSFGNASSDASGNLFVDFFVFSYTLESQIVLFLKVMIFIAAVFMITLAGIQLLTSRGREEKLKEAKNKILYTILALIFVGIVEVWQRVAFEGIVQEGVNLFGTLANLALFFTVPVAIFFLSLAAYYLITANGDEEQLKKAKSIVINTVLATLILLATYTFLLELATL